MWAGNALGKIICVVLAFAGGAATAAEEEGAPRNYDEKAALDYSQAALGQTVGDYTLINQDGASVELRTLQDRPYVVSLIFTSCYHTCPMLTANLSRVVDIAREALGDESFRVLTVGFDTAADTPARMRSYARERGIALDDWYFLSADELTIDSLARDLGFIFFPSPRGFDHLAQTTVVSAEGVVYAQVYGAAFQPPQLIEPLKRLVFGTTPDATPFAGWIKGVQLFCTVYDPATGRYKFDYSIFVMIGAGLVSLGGIAVFLVKAWRQNRSAGV